MSRIFFEQVDDEVRGLLLAKHPGFDSARSGQLIKLWYGDPLVHFEAQWISKRWIPRGLGRRGEAVAEVGLHLEANSREKNDSLLESLIQRERSWRKHLPDAETGKAIGPNGSTWRRLSELIPLEDEDDPDLAGELAERLAVYVRTLKPLLDKGSDR